MNVQRELELALDALESISLYGLSLVRITAIGHPSQQIEFDANMHPPLTAVVSSLLLLTAHGFALIAVRHARLVVVRASDLDEGDALLAEAVGALQDLRVAVASERVERCLLYTSPSPRD